MLLMCLINWRCATDSAGASFNSVIDGEKQPLCDKAPACHGRCEAVAPGCAAVLWPGLFVAGEWTNGAVAGRWGDQTIPRLPVLFGEWHGVVSGHQLLHDGM